MRGKQQLEMEVSNLTVRVRAVEADDVPTLGRMAYESFATINVSIGCPRGIDWDSAESATASIKFLSSTPPIHGVVAVDNTSGALLGAGYIHPGPLYRLFTNPCLCISEDILTVKSNPVPGHACHRFQYLMRAGLEMQKL